MNVARACPRCGTSLSETAVGGLCLTCLGRLGFLFESGNGAKGEPSVPPRERFGDYELLSEIARGGMGVVYRARQVSLNRVVAVKMVLHGQFSSEEFIQRFRNEAQAAAALHHPNIVPIYEVGDWAGQPFFSMEFIEGQTLADTVRAGPLTANRAAEYVKSIAGAIDYAHEQGVLHRDLKPSNILVDIFDEPRITDFGLAKLVTNGTELTITGQALGSPGHMPPEQAAGHPASAGRQGDVYSLGAILYHLLTGRPPFQGETVQQVLLQAQTAEPVSPQRLNPSIPAALQTICLKCLEKEPGRRYATAAGLAEDLRRFLAHEPIQARPVSPPQKLWLWCRRHPGPASLSAALLVAILVGLSGVLGQWQRAERHASGEALHRQRAESYANQVRLNLYAADISLASQAWLRGDYGLARRTLLGLKPKAGEADLRGFEWRLLWNYCRGDQLATFTGHDWIVTCAAFSPNGRLLATGSQDGTAKVWDLPGRQLLTSLPCGTGAVWTVGFTPDGTELMTATTEGVHLWDSSSWKVVRTFPGRLGALAAKGELLATAESSPFSWEQNGAVVLWNYRTGEEITELSKHGRVVSFSPDGRRLAVAGVDKAVELWAVPSGKWERTLPTENPVWSLTFAPNGEQLVTAGWSETALVWDLSKPGPPRRLTGHQRTIWSSVYSPDGATLITSSSDQSIRFWDAITLQPKGQLRGHESEVWCVAVSPDGQTLATGGKDATVRLWPAAPAVARDCLPNQTGHRPLFSPDGKLLELLGPARGEWHGQLWDVPGRVRSRDVPDGTIIGFTRDRGNLLYLNEGNATLTAWSSGNSREQGTQLDGHGLGLDAFARTGMSPEGKRVFAIAKNGVARFWDAASGQLLRSCSCPNPPIRAVVLGPRGEHLALSVERENIVRLYNLTTGAELQLAGHRDFVSGLAFSPDGAMLATGSMDGTIRLWEVARGKALGQLSGHMEEVTDLAFAPDGLTLASVARKDGVKLWHVATGRELVSLDVPTADRWIQFAPDGQCLAVTTEENTVRLFEAPLGQEP
ncbi:MAG TPA: protein kinase [Candidatus Acidoferrum sp.]|nr:protein kinase [Candidatus Acidoferrum sp.]